MCPLSKICSILRCPCVAFGILKILKTMKILKTLKILNDPTNHNFRKLDVPRSLIPLMDSWKSCISWEPCWMPLSKICRVLLYSCVAIRFLKILKVLQDPTIHNFRKVDFSKSCIQPLDPWKPCFVEYLVFWKSWKSCNIPYPFFEESVFFRIPKIIN